MIEKLKLPLSVNELMEEYSRIFGFNAADVIDKETLFTVASLLNEAYFKGLRDGKLGIDKSN